MPEFRIQRCLGRGGFGEVYKAVMSRGNGVDMDVAIKVLRSDLDPSSQGIQRLRDEGRLLGRMTHPSILRVYDLVIIQGHAALVSEFVAGDDLTRILKEEVIPQRPAFEIVAQLAAALDAAWSQPSVADGKPLHLVHRDIKPDNVRIDPFGAVKLLDFGIAQASRVRREAHTSVNTIMGSTQYLSPERLVQQEVGPEADVFALGCTAFEVITGETLFARKSMRQMYLLMVDEDRFAQFVSDRCATHTVRLGELGTALVRDMTAYDKRRRPTAGEVATRCDTAADNMTGATLRSWCRTRTWSPPPEMTGPLEGLSFVVTTGSGVGPLPPTATAQMLLPTTAELRSVTPATTQRLSMPEPEERTLDDLDLRALTENAPAEPSGSGPSPWTPEERSALSASMPVTARVPAAPDSTAGSPPVAVHPGPARSGSPTGTEPTDPNAAATASSDSGNHQVPDDLPEPPGTQRLPLLERQRSPELWPLPMMAEAIPPVEDVRTTPVTLDEGRAGPSTGEVTVRLQRKPRLREDGSTTPRRRLTRSATGETVRETTKELPLSEALADPTVRMLRTDLRTTPIGLDEPTQSGDAQLRDLVEEDTTNPSTKGPLVDEVPTGGGDDEVLEAMEATTGSRELPSGMHRAERREQTDPGPKDEGLPSGDETLPEPPIRTPPSPSSTPPPPPRLVGVNPYTGLLASVGGVVGLGLGGGLLLLLLAVAWLLR